MPRPLFQTFALTIACTSIERSTAFYEGVLGAKRLPSDDNGVGWHYQLGGLRIALLPNAELPSPAVFPTHAMPVLWLETDNLEAAYAHCIQQGIVLRDAPLDGPYIQIADPDGLVIEIWEKSV